MVILAEGNVSAIGDDGSFWVKGSGLQMASMTQGGFSRVSLEKVQASIHRHFEDDLAIRSALNEACLGGPPPSTETFMHALLLGLSGVEFVAHVHPTPLLSILSLANVRDWVGKRLFPDEVVCCGPASCFVPYVAPGLALAQAIQQELAAFRSRYGIDPKTLWLQNHGLIATGGSAKEVESACLMSVKAARVLLGALQSHREVKWLTDAEVAHIYHWPDEHARQKAIWG